jgi:hypothetical protein
MTRAQKRDAAFALALLLAVALFALAAGAPAPVRGIAALLCVAVVAAHVVTGDEVERALSMRAGAAAFGLAATVALVAAVADRPDLLADGAHWLWAWRFGLYMISWTVLRVARG